MVIEWSDEDNAFIVTVPELVGCRTHGRTYEEAVKNAEDVLYLYLLGHASNPPPPNKFIYRWWSDEQIAAQGLSMIHGDDEELLPYQVKDEESGWAAEQKMREQDAQSKREWFSSKS